MKRHREQNDEMSDEEERYDGKTRISVLFPNGKFSSNDSTFLDLTMGGIPYSSVSKLTRITDKEKKEKIVEALLNLR